jgi:hypothetical protein
LRVARVGGENVLVLVQAVTGRSGPQLQLRTAAIPPIAGDRLAHPLAWSAPIVVSPAGLATIDQWAVAVRGGEVATSVLGTRSPGTYGGFVSVVRDVLAPPLVWSAEVNDPASPLLRSAPTDAKDDFIGIDIGPDGTPWASFFASCAAEGAPAQTDPACAGAYLGGQAINAQIQGGNDRGLVASVLFPR